MLSNILCEAYIFVMSTNTGNLKLLIFILSAEMLLSACITSFQVGQEAHTLPKHTLEAGAELGGFKLGGGVRYGFLNKLDGGLYYNPDLITNYKDKFQPLSVDIKWQLLSSPKEHFVLSTGAGFGTGVERTTLWNEAGPYYSEEDAWYKYGSSSVDAYLPVYLSVYLHDSRFLYSFNFNPYLIYRLGFYEKVYDPNIYRSFHFDYRKMNIVLPGSAFSIMISDKHSTMSVAVLNFLHSNSQIYDPNPVENFEVYWTYSHKFNLGRNRK